MIRQAPRLHKKIRPLMIRHKLVLLLSLLPFLCLGAPDNVRGDVRHR